MDLATTLSLVQTILTVIQTLGLMTSVSSIFACDSELEDLKNTVEYVRAVLMDADAKQDSLNFQEQKYVKDLKDAVYDADDVLDEFLTLAKQQQLRDGRDKFSDKVRSFFSRFKHLTHNLSSKVKTVNDKLDKIANKIDKFSFKIECKPVKFTKEETSSFICDEIIGREEDAEKIIGVLLGSVNVEQSPVSFLVIVGMGGLGKTALAQLVYKDPKVSEAFQLKRWTCIADQDQDQWSLKGCLGKVVEGSSINDKTSLEGLQHEVKRQLGGKKYLIVLDDVWTESYDDWQKFKGFLNVGGRGSWIIVTTRSKKTAQMIGDDRVHVLKGLSEPDSWHLFERMAFQAVERDDELVKLGKEIVKKCINVPLAIRVVASLLRAQSKSKWLSFHDKGLDCLSECDDTMTRVLKLSYDQLNPSLKACFAYCAIFPKDWVISKQTLIQLWMAQGYIISENLGEEYFLILLQRCFFQDIREDKFGADKWFKIHDLLHDLAEKVAGEEICTFNSDTYVGNKVRHLSFVSDPHAYHIFNSDTYVGKKIRTCLQIKNYHITDQLLASKCIPKWTYLRSLKLSHSNAKHLPESIGQLLHLRNLDLSSSHHLEVLPKSITKLVNLQTFDLQQCGKLKQLPDGLSKLVDLSTLNLDWCSALRCMPAGIGMLTCLHTLCHFVVGLRATSTTEQCFNGLKDLKHLNKLKGSLTIEIAVLKNAKYVKEEHGGGGYLRCKEHLERIVFMFRRGEEYGSKECEQALLEEMEPYHDVKTLKLNGYHGETLPRWPGRGDSSTVFDFPNLVTLHISSCSELLYLPWQVAKLPHLKTLDIFLSSNLEYIVGVDSKTFILAEESSFFASLETLYISNSPNLKGWWRKSKSGSQVINPSDYGSRREADIEWVSSPCFPLLKRLSLLSCEKMIFVPLCPRLEHLFIVRSKIELDWEDTRSTACHQLSSPLSYPDLKTLRIHNLEWLESMPVKYTQFLEKIHIADNESLESLGEVKELLPPCLLSSLRTFHITDCPKLKSVGGWLDNLSALEYLWIYNCPKVELDGMSWHNLAATLQTLDLGGFEEMEELPEGMQYCTSVRELSICDWPKLKSVPKWMPKLTSLHKLNLVRCSESLKERCQKPNGEDWPLIQHFSQLEVR